MNIPYQNDMKKNINYENLDSVNQNKQNNKIFNNFINDGKYNDIDVINNNFNDRSFYTQPIN